ncbi:MAG: DUF3421 domain-containing protein, partial [Magnetococcales bacterium]|nr:DUF3421 domain-containing protein [Magnetococcales bacterium]
MQLCRAFSGGGVHPGVTLDKANGCLVRSRGRTVLASKFQRLVGEGYQWKPSTGQVGWAVAAGYSAGKGGKTLYPCRARLGTALFPGEHLPGSGFCVISWSGKSQQVKPFEMLHGPMGGLDLNGLWGSGRGDMRIIQGQGKVTGDYEKRGGRLEGSVNGNVMTGYWTQIRSPKRCSSIRQDYSGRNQWHWG